MGLHDSASARASPTERSASEPQHAAPCLAEDCALFRLVEDPVLVVETRDGHVVRANPAACRLLDLPADAPPPGFLTDLFVAESAAGGILAAASRDGRATVRGVVCRRAGGGTFLADVSAATDTRGGQEYATVVLRDVVERDHLEAMRREADRLYASLFEETRDAAYISTKDGRIVAVNRAFRTMFGYSDHDDLRGASVQDLYVDPVDRLRFQRAIEEQGGAVKDFEVRLRRRDGSRLWCVLTSTLARSPAGEVASYQGVLRDVTESRRREEDLREAAERARRHESALVELATRAQAGAEDLDSTLRAIVRGAARALGVARASCWFLTPDRLRLACRVSWAASSASFEPGGTVDVADYPRYFENLSAVRVVDVSDAQSDPRSSEFTEGYLRPFGITSMLDAAVRISGSLVGVVCHEHIGAPRPWKPDEVTFAAAVADQVANAVASAERRNAQSGLKEREEFLSAVFENIPAVVFVKSATDFRYLRINLAAESLFGRPLDQVVGRTDDEIFPPAAAAALRDADLEALRSGRLVDIPERWIEAPGRGTVAVHLKTMSMPDETGTPRYVLGILEDVTEGKRLQEQVLQSEKMSALGLLLSGVAHELNNPMTGVIGFSELLLHSPDLSDRSRQFAERIASEAARTRRIVQNLLAFSRPQRSERRCVDLNEILERVLDLRLYEMRVRDIETVRHFGENLPPVLADDQRLQQVFMNVVLNAEHAMLESHGRGLLVVETSWVPERDVVRVALTDDGPGIPPEHLPRIFDPFFTTKPAGEGTGLGLSISYRIVREHGGRIVAQSRPEGGAVFVVELPAHREAEAVEPPATPATAGARVRGCRVLVVDDEPAILELVKEALGAEGHSVSTADDGDSAIDRIQQEHFDAVVCDMKMPRGSGAHVYLFCRAKEPSLARRFLFMTGDVVSPDSVRFLEEHGLPSVAKPFDLTEFVREVSALLAPEVACD